MVLDAPLSLWRTTEINPTRIDAVSSSLRGASRTISRKKTTSPAKDHPRMKKDAGGGKRFAQNFEASLTEAQMQEALEETSVSNPDLQQVLQQLERKGFLTPWQTNKLLKGDTDGFFLGGYRLLYKIASGSFGRVYRADDPQSGRVVAIKVLRRRWSEDKQKIDLFIREGK